MSVAKKWKVCCEDTEEIAQKWLTSSSLVSYRELGALLGMTEQNVGACVHACLPPEVVKARAALRYAKDKEGILNPQYGKRTRYRGVCTSTVYPSDVQGGTRFSVHVRVFLNHLGLSCFPEGMEIHHIDGDKSNYSMDNLALCTASGHHHIHRLQEPESKVRRLRASHVEVLKEYLTST